MIGTKLIRKVIFVFSTHDTHSELCNAIRIVRGYRKEKWGYFLRAESFYSVATQEEMYADAEHPSAGYHEKSHGESFLTLAFEHLRPNELYLFDEPEAALSPQRQLSLLMELCLETFIYILTVGNNIC